MSRKSELGMIYKVEWVVLGKVSIARTRPHDQGNEKKKPKKLQFNWGLRFQKVRVHGGGPKT